MKRSELKKLIKEELNETQDVKYYKNLLAEVEDGLNELVNIGVDYEIFQNAKSANKFLKQAYKLVNKVS